MELVSPGPAQDRGNILASHPAAPGLNPGSAVIFSFYCLVGALYRDQTHLVQSNGFHQCSLR